MTGLHRLLQGSAAIALVLGIAGAVLPGDAGIAAATGAVTVVVAAPLVRVLWLAVRWVRKGDVRFAGLAVVLLAVVATGAAISLAT
jgi:hypothetical protein